MDNETKIIYHIEGEPTPYGVRVRKPPAEVTLKDFKGALCKPKLNFKYFFKATEDNIGMVKEQISNDAARLPFMDGRIEAWLVRVEEPNYTNVNELQAAPVAAPESNIVMDGNESDAAASTSSRDDDGVSQASSMHDMTVYSSMQEFKLRPKPRERRKRRVPQHSGGSSCSSLNESTLATLSVQLTTVHIDMQSANFLGIAIAEQRSANGERSIHIEKIVKGGAVALDGRIEHGDLLLQVNDVVLQNVSKEQALRVLRAAVEHPGPIKLIVAKCPDEAGYATLQRGARSEAVSTITSNAWTAAQPAARTNGKLHELLGSSSASSSKPTMINEDTATAGAWLLPSDTASTQLTASCAHSRPVEQVEPELYASIPGGGDSTYSEPARPIDPAAWVVQLDRAQTFSHRAPAELLRRERLEQLVRAMAKPGSGLDIRDRLWLKLHVPNAFLGSDAVNWIAKNVENVADKREARRIVKQLLAGNYIKHTLDKQKFSEKCYYAINEERHFPDCMSHFGCEEYDSGSTDVGTLAAPSNYVAYTGTYYPVHGIGQNSLLQPLTQLNLNNDYTVRHSPGSRGSH